MRTPDQPSGSSPLLTFIRAVCLALAVVLAVWAQRIFRAERGHSLPLTALALLAAAVVLLVALTIQTEPTLQGTRLNRWLAAAMAALLARPLRTISGGIALTGCLIATAIGQTHGLGWYALCAWMVGVACALLAAHNGHPHVDLRQWLIAHRAEVGLVVACTVAALIIRTVDLATLPAIVTGDEGSIGLEARDIIAGRNDPLFITGWTGMPRFTFLTMAVPMKIWGADIFGLRMHAAIVGTATIVTLYWLLRTGGDMWLAQCAIWLLATYPYHIHVSRLGLNNADDGLLITLTFAALFWGIRSRKPLGWAVAGTVAALSLYTYPGARITILLAVGVVALLAVPSRGRWVVEHRLGLVVACLLFLATALPMLRYDLTHWPEFNTRVNDVGIIQSGWLAQEVQHTGRNAVAIVFDQFLRSFFAYGFYGDTSGFYGDPGGLLQFWPAALFPLGLAIGLFYLRQPVFMLLISWFFGVVIVGGTLTQSPPYATRLSSLAPVYASFVALALVTLFGLGSRLTIWSRRVAMLGTAIVVLAIGVSGVGYYFTQYSGQPWFGDPNAELATAAGTYLSRLPSTTHAYFLGLPRMFYNFSTLSFLAPAITGSDAPEKLTGLPPEFDRGQPAFFFAIPERAGELRHIQQLLPGGHWIEVQRTRDHAPLFFAYQMDRPASALLGLRHLKKI